MSFLIGILGAFVFIVALGAGFAAGVYAEKQLSSLRKPKPEETPDAVLDKLRQEQEAFSNMQSYTVERAYGLDSPLPTSKG